MKSALCGFRADRRQSVPHPVAGWLPEILEGPKTWVKDEQPVTPPESLQALMNSSTH